MSVWLPQKHSIEPAALNAIDSIINRMELGLTPKTVCLDLYKAFDTLDHSILISKLKYYGIQGCALDLIKITYQIDNNVYK